MSQFFTSGGQSIGVSATASVRTINIQHWFPLRWTGWISLQPKGLSRIFSNTIVQKHQLTAKATAKRPLSKRGKWKRMDSQTGALPQSICTPRRESFIGRTDAEAETPTLWPPDVKNWLIWKDPDSGKDWGRRRRGQQSMRWLDGITDLMDMYIYTNYITSKPCHASMYYYGLLL